MNGFQHYRNTLTNNYSNFSGRARRAEYWYFLLFNALFGYALLFLGMAIAAPFGEDLFILGIIPYLLFFLAIIIPALGVLVRRLHDIGKSGWYYFMGFIPIAGPIILLVYFVTDSQPGHNKWGPNPKGIGNDTSERDVTDHLID